jgi:DNA repair exonuclease SbcCD ATPase subunit
MAVRFHSVKWRNFFATGNVANEIQLDKTPTTLIVGKNGCGKSTFSEAICFALFGKPYRNVNKPQVVNTINNKNCVVEIEFSIGKKHYKVIRGIKPSIFEIWVNDELLNQDAASKDYQAFLEDNILKMNYRSFTQIVILGTASFTPFMQLPAAQRREIIEELLDIKIFTAMNQVLKERISSLKSQLVQIDNQITLSKKTAEIQVQYIRQLESDRDTRLQELVDKKKNTTSEIRTLKTQLGDLEVARTKLMEKTLDKAKLSLDLSTALTAKRELELDLERLKKDTKFYHDTAVCPKCKQDIDHTFRDEVLKENTWDAHEKEGKLAGVDTSVLALQIMQDDYHRIDTELQATNISVAKTNTKIESLNTQVSTLKKEYNEVVSRVDALEIEQQKVKDLAKVALQLVQSRGKLVEEQHYNDIAAIMLKDSGIKTRVIKQYLPAINMLVNKYLTTMDFYVQFTLDEKFDEIIKSRHRDTFSYNSFSEGEKQRIDLALLFTWRQIAKLKQSADTNLLLLDEVFDSSLDDEGVDHVMALLKELKKDTNVFVISHKGEKLKDKFKHVIQFEKKNNFSVIVE